MSPTASDNMKSSLGETGSRPFRRSSAIELWDWRQRKVVARWRTGGGMWVVAVAFSPDGKKLASLTFDGKVQIWDVARFR